MFKSTGQPDGDVFKSQSVEFLHWFSGYSTVNNKIEITDLRRQDAGRGVVATQDLDEGEELFSIPRTLVLDAQNSELLSKLRRRDAIPDTDAWLPLILVIIYEYLRGDASPWRPYMAILPTKFNTLMFWSDAELAELQGSEVLNKIGKKDAEESWTGTIIPYMLKNADLFPLEGTEIQKKKELVRLAHWAGSLIMAYAFDIDKDDASNASAAESEEDVLVEEDEEEENSLKGMVPFADLLNADADRNNARLYQEPDHLIMRTTRSVAAGEELYNDYGPLPSSELFRMYGYLTPNYTQYDVVELSYDLINETAQKADPEWKKASNSNLSALEELDLIETGYTIQRPTSEAILHKAIPGELHMLLRALCCELGNSEPKRAKKESITLNEATLLSAVCTKRLSDYATTLEEDAAVLASPIQNPSSRLHSAITVRMGEKLILHSIIQLCQGYVEEENEKIAAGGTKRKHLAEEGRVTERQKKARMEKGKK